MKPKFNVGDVVKSKSGSGYSDNAEGVVIWSSDTEVEIQLTKAKRKKDVGRIILYQSWEISYLNDNKENLGPDCVSTEEKLYRIITNPLILDSLSKEEIGECLNLVDKQKERVKSLYCYTKLPKSLTLLSKLCKWGDNKHGAGPIKKDVDYKAKQQAHIVRMMSGEKLDRESGLPHQLAIAFNMLAEIENELSETDLEELLK